MKARKRTEMGREIYQRKFEMNPKVKFFLIGFAAGFFFTVILINCLR